MSSLAAIESNQLFLADLKAMQEELGQALEKRWIGFNSQVAKSAAYSLLLPSKRLRPIFCLETCRAFSGSHASAMSAALALEMIHTYSLIHDDLPAMDNDDLRRGKPTNHKVFGEARAILAGDALLTYAFQVIADDEEISADSRVHLISELAKAAGVSGMILGQDLDIENEVHQLADLEKLHRLKTGALLASSLVMGGICGGQENEVLNQLRNFGLEMGLAFQIRDDVLDVEGDEKMGKPIKSDERNSKPTYVSILGLEAAKAEQRRWLDQALQTLNSIRFKHPHRLIELTHYVIDRCV